MGEGFREWTEGVWDRGGRGVQGVDGGRGGRGVQGVDGGSGRRGCGVGVQGVDGGGVG